MPHKTAEQISADAGDDVNKKIACGSISFFNQRADIHQHPHVETDVEKAGVQKNRHHKAPRLDQIVRQRQRASEPCEHQRINPAELKECAKSSAGRRLKSVCAHCEHQRDGVKQAAQSENRVGDRRSGGHPTAERLACRGQRESHARAALMAARGGGASQSAARRTEARTSLRLFSSKKPSYIFAEPVEFPAPPQRKGQSASLLQNLCVSIIPENEEEKLKRAAE